MLPLKWNNTINIMSYAYGKDVLNIKNPLKDAGKLMIIRGAITTFIGIILLLSIKNIMANAQQGVAYITLAASVVILADGVINLISGLMKLFRFLVGREVPADLIKNRYYNESSLLEMLNGRKNLTFKSPANFLEHLIISIYENYMFLPPPIRNIIYHFIKQVYYAALIMLTYGLILLANYLGFTQLMDNNLLPWYTFILFLFMMVVFIFSQPIGEKLYKPLPKRKDIVLSVLILLIAISLPFVSSVFSIDLPYPPVKPVPYVLFILAVTVVSSILTLALAYFRSQSIEPSTAVSEFREHWTQNLHPQDILRSFSNELENIRYKELPHRDYIKLNPELSMEGSMDKGTYNGQTLIETQPYSKEKSEIEMLAKIRAITAIFGHLIGIIASIILYINVKNFQSLQVSTIINTFLPVIILYLFSSYLTKLSLQYWSEVIFESFLLHLKVDGTYTESTISTGRAIYDSTSSENKLVRSSITSKLLISRLLSTTYAGGLGKNLNQSRYILTMERADEMQNLVINGIKKFMNEKEIIANIVSDKDKKSTDEIHRINLEQRKNIIEDPEKEIKKFKPGNHDSSTLPPNEDD